MFKIKFHNIIKRMFKTVLSANVNILLFYHTTVNTQSTCYLNIHSTVLLPYLQ